MLKELKFVQGAVAKKDLLPAMTHFVIDNGRVRGFNGTLALCSPIALDISCKPKATELISAINNCNETMQLSMTAKGRLSIKSGSYKALVNCVNEDTMHPEPEGEVVQLDGVALLAALKAIWPFVGDDASRVWTNGVLLRENSAYATNNVCLVEYWIGTAFPHVVNIPRTAVREMIRIDEPPTHAQLVPGSNLTFHYADGRWVRTQLLETGWPDLGKVLNVPSTQQPINPVIFDALQAIKPAVDKMGKVYFRENQLSTQRGELEEAGAAFDVPGTVAGPIFNFEMLSLLKGSADTIDLSLYPKACIFFGHGKQLRGAIIGMKEGNPDVNN